MADTLERKQSAVAATWPSIPEEVFDEVDRAQRASDVRITAALDATITEARAQLAHALEVLDDGYYGVCESCGRRIGAARLAICPESTKCVDCQKASDRSVRGDFTLRGRSTT